MAAQDLIRGLPNRNTVFQTWSTNPTRRLVRSAVTVQGAMDAHPPPAAAGVLPFCLEQGKLLFLLGREAPRQNFRGAGTWCDFGGGMHGKKNSVQVAAQELQEETIGSLIDDTGRLEMYIAENLKLFICSDAGRKTPYHMYVIQVPYSDIPSIFRWRMRVARKYRNMDNSCRSSERVRLQSEQPGAFQVNGKVRKAWLEKDDIQWVDVNNLHRFPLRWEFQETIQKHNVIANLRSLVVTNEDLES